MLFTFTAGSQTIVFPTFCLEAIEIERHRESLNLRRAKLGASGGFLGHGDASSSRQDALAGVNPGISQGGVGRVSVVPESTHTPAHLRRRCTVDSSTPTEGFGGV